MSGTPITRRVVLAGSLAPFVADLRADAARDV